MLQEKALMGTLFSQSKDAEKLLSFLSQEIADQVREFHPRTQVDLGTLLSADGWSFAIHYSWFYPLLKDLPLETQALFLSVLTEEQARGVRNLLTIVPPPVTSSPLTRPFLIDHLRSQLQRQKEVIPIAYLPETELDLLLTLERKYLLYLADLLGIYDLAAQMRQIVDRTLIAKIHQALPSSMLNFLNYCMKQSLKWIPAKLPLAGWDGSKKHLIHLLHGRGLGRLARALLAESESFNWHLLHRLDVGRATVIENTWAQNPDPALAPHFKQQVLHILHRYKL